MSQIVYPTVCPGHTKGIYELCYQATNDGTFFISASHDKLPMLRDGITGDWIGTFEGHQGAVWSAKLDAQAIRAATGSADSSARLWNALNGDCIHTFEHKRVVRTVDFCPTANVLATGGYESIVRLYNLDKPTLDPTVLSIPNFASRIKKLLWAPDGRTIFMGSEDGTLRLWDLATGKVARELTGLFTHDPSKSGVQDMEYNPYDYTLTIAVGEHVTFVDTLSFKVLRSHHLGREIETASRHPVHGKTYLAGGSDVWVRLFDTETGAELLTQKGHHGKVHCLRFAPNGTTYTSGADDATIRMWRYDEPQRPANANTNTSSSSSSSSSN